MVSVRTLSHINICLDESFIIEQSPLSSANDSQSTQPSHKKPRITKHDDRPTNRNKRKHRFKRKKPKHQSAAMIRNSDKIETLPTLSNATVDETPPTSDASEPPSPFVSNNDDDDDRRLIVNNNIDNYLLNHRPLSAPPSTSSVYSRPPISVINSTNDASTTNRIVSAIRCHSKAKNARVNFDGVTVYYFERSQGNSCVPSFGGVTLGK